MKFITYQQYIECLKNNNTMYLEEEKEPYQLIGNLGNRIYKEEEVKEIDKRHDKMFRKVLSRKSEMAKFLKEFLALKEQIEEEQLVQCHTDFITRKYKNRQSDILYRLKDQPVYFLVEHQSTIHQEMPLRILEYIEEIVKMESATQNTYLSPNNIYPIIIPIVIYTGYQKWNAKTNFAKKQYQGENYKSYRFDLEYNLIAVQDYDYEELLKKKSLLGSIMLIEKCKNKEDMNEQMNKIIEIMREPEERELLSEIVVNILEPIIGKENTTIMLEKINKKEVYDMSPFTKMLLDYKYDVMEAFEKGKKELEEGKRELEEGKKNLEKGKKKLEEGKKNLEEKKKQMRKEGKLETIKETVKNMMQFGESDEKIMKYIGINKEELEDIKGMLIHS